MVHGLEVGILQTIDGLHGNLQNQNGDVPKRLMLRNADRLCGAKLIIGLISEHFNVACEELGFWTNNGLKPEKDTIGQLKHFFDGHKIHAERFVNFVKQKDGKSEQGQKVLLEFGNAKRDMQRILSELEH